MAKYTELFSEYLESGYSLPDEFGLIDGFEDIFKLHFCDKEIGFETEALFAMKLQERASIYCPLFAERIARKASAWLEFDAPAKVYYDSIFGTLTNGAQKGKTTELPFDASTATPSVINETEQFANQEARTDERRETGKTPDEVMKTLDFLNKHVSALVDDLLLVFKPLFMGLY